MKESKVYFIDNITSDNLIKMYEVLNKDLPGKIAIKISTGERGNPNYLNPGLIEKLVKKINATIIECNTAYEGGRNTTFQHMKTIREHGFDKIAKVDIMDAKSEISLPVTKGFHLKQNYVGSNIKNYDSILILSHFKGHPMGGFGGALKNMSIGIASSSGKAWIHTAGKQKDINTLWENLAPQNDFLESMADACKSIVDYMGENIVYINVINNLSVDCDCVANPEKVKMKDIGIASSLDPVALDKACVDLIYNSEDKEKKYLIERIEKQNATHILEASESLKIGSTQYELIKVN